MARLLPLVLSYTIARGAGILAYYVWGGGRQRCIANMLHVTGGDRRAAQHLARCSFSNYGAYLVDFVRLIGARPEEVQRRMILEDWERIAAMRTGNGIVFATIHFGLWDLGAIALSANGFPVTTIADPFHNPRIDELILGTRKRLGLTIVSADRMGPRVLRALKRNQVTALLIDVPSPEAGIQVEFFGELVAVPDTFARLALRAQSPVIAATLPRIGRWNDHARGRVEPVTFEPTGDIERDVRDLTQATFHTLESQIRDDPAQWYIFRRLWLEPDVEPTGSAA